ncbi:MAG: patatin-like phospholipase family protein [Chloroflexota bacterium]
MDICVALGGGGARGLAHIGVLRVLEREGFQIRAIAGTSMGGVIAALYAAGYTPDDMLQRWATTSLPLLLRARPEGSGLIGLRRVAEALRTYLDRKAFSDLRVPLAVTATNLETGREVVITQGDVVEAVLATIALPGIFPPAIQGEHRLVDGGMVDPVPVEPARRLYPAPVVAVALSPSPEQWAEAKSPSPLSLLPLFDVFARLRPGQALSVFLRALEISARAMTELHLQLSRPDVTIRPAVWHIGLFDGAAVTEAAGIGERAAEAALPKLHALFAPRRRLARSLRRALGLPRP